MGILHSRDECEIRGMQGLRYRLFLPPSPAGPQERKPQSPKSRYAGLLPAGSLSEPREEWGDRSGKDFFSLPILLAACSVSRLAGQKFKAFPGWITLKPVIFWLLDHDKRIIVISSPEEIVLVKSVKVAWQNTQKLPLKNQKLLLSCSKKSRHQSLK